MAAVAVSIHIRQVSIPAPLGVVRRLQATGDGRPAEAEVRTIETLRAAHNDRKKRSPCVASTLTAGVGVGCDTVCSGAWEGGGVRTASGVVGGCGACLTGG